jgi:hypothetical protein
VRRKETLLNLEFKTEAVKETALGVLGRAIAAAQRCTVHLNHVDVKGLGYEIELIIFDKKVNYSRFKKIRRSTVVLDS